MSTILLVERDAGERQKLTSWLVAAGHQVVPAETLESLDQGCQADMLISDMEGDHEAVLPLLKQIRAARPTIAIVVTAFATWHGWRMLRDTMRLGADDFLIKPFDEDEVVPTVERAFERARAVISATEAA